MHFAYLRRREAVRRRVEAAKDRPCVVLIVDIETQPGSELVGVLPMTYSPPENPGDALELPSSTERRLGLDEARSWVVVTESNDFTSPGYDLRPKPPKAAPTTARPPVCSSERFAKRSSDMRFRQSCPRPSRTVPVRRGH